MPELRVELGDALAGKPLADGLVTDLGAPLGQLQGVSFAVDAGQLGGVSSGASSVDGSPVGLAVARVAERAAPLLGTLPGVGDVVGPLLAAIEAAERLAPAAGSGDIFTQLRDLWDRVAAGTEGGGGLPSVLLRVASALSSAPEGRVVLELVDRLTRRHGVDATSKLPVGDALQALDGSARTLGGLMVLQSVLSDAERLTGAMAAQLDAAAARRDVALLETMMAGDGVSLPDFIDGVAADDPASVAAALGAVTACATRLEGTRISLATAMGMGEATLTYLDIDRVLLEAAGASTLVRGADVSALHRLATSLGATLAPFVSIDPVGTAGQSLGDLLTTVESKVADTAAQVAALDVVGFVSPVSGGIEQLVGVLGTVSDAIAGVTVTYRSAMNAVRDAVAALPVQQIADAIRTFLQPITAVIDAIKDLLDDIETALDQAAGVAQGAIGQVDTLLVGFKDALDTLFADAKTFVENLHLDQAIGAVSDNIKTFADELAKADMKPYFDTAGQVIDTTADVISALPFSLLPDSMKQQVDDAVRPIKETDAAAVEQQIKSLLQIGPDGKFELRPVLEQAIAEVQAKYDELLVKVRELDPRLYLAAVETKLQEIADRINEISPDLTLQLVQDAVDQVKDAIVSFDLEAELQPVTDVFKRIDDTLEQFKPSNLVKPLEDRLTEVRGRIVAAIRLDQWSPFIDDAQGRVLGLLDLVDPARLVAQLRAGLGDVTALLDRLPTLSAAGGLGRVVVSLLAGQGLRIHVDSFEAVLRWLGGASGSAELAAQAAAASDAVTVTRDAVRGLDLAALGATVVLRAAGVRAAITRLVGRLPADTPVGAQLTDVAARLDAGAVFGALAANRARYLALLERSATGADTLRRTGFTEVDVAVNNLGAALAPLQPARDFLNRILDMLGLGAARGGGLAGVVRELLKVVTPDRLVGVVEPLFSALRGRLQALLDAVIVPLKAGVGRVSAIIGAIDLKPFTDAADAVFAEIKAQIDQLSPLSLLQAPLASFKALQDDLRAHDPMEKVIAIITSLRDAIGALLGKLSLEQLLASPLAIYDHIVEELGTLNLNGLLDPLFEKLDVIAKQVSDGLDNTVTAFEHLQQALPGDGGGGGGASVSASLAVG